MHPVNFKILISDPNFINDDGTLAKTATIARTSRLDKDSSIIYHFQDGSLTIDFFFNLEIAGRFYKDEAVRDYMLKEKFLIKNPRASRFQATTREIFHYTLSNLNPAIGNWLIWNHL
jgi:hypothetical protein